VPVPAPFVEDAKTILVVAQAIGIGCCRFALAQGRGPCRRCRPPRYDDDREKAERQARHEPCLSPAGQHAPWGLPVINHGRTAGGVFRHDSPFLLELEASFPEREISAIDDLWDDVSTVLDLEIHKRGRSVLYLVKGRELRGVGLDVGELTVMPYGADEEWPLVLQTE